MMYLQSAGRGQHKGHVSAFSARLRDFPGTKKALTALRQHNKARGRRKTVEEWLESLGTFKETALKTLKVPQHSCRIEPKWMFVFKPGASHQHERELLNFPTQRGSPHNHPRSKWARRCVTADPSGRRLSAAFNSRRTPI